jgi:3',5'-cyclic AMP phosphodiesterase CpdA
MLVAQITDLHISTPDSKNDRHYRTADHLARAVVHLASLPRRPDLVLATGDLVERGHPDEYARLRRILTGLPFPIYPVPGNHDAREALRTAFSDLPVLQGGDRFAHYVVEGWPLRLIGLDTVVPGKPSGEMCGERLAWLDARLAEATDRPTILFMHHPPFLTGLGAMDEMGLAGREAFEEVVRRHPQVERVVCGHVHRPITARFGGTVAMACPSTAHQIALDLPPEPRLAVIMERPACLLHLWHAGRLVSHYSPIGTSTPAYALFDGEEWVADDARPPAGFHPAN